MAPFVLTGIVNVVVTIVIGIGFGFVLERSGFGNARNLAAQFYLHDMRVLKVMFTAIVTAMLLTFGASAIGLLDFSLVWVPPTRLWPGVVGGFVLGLGFIIGGYCPGTSLVSAATFKLDGVMFVLGVSFGLFAFAEMSPLIWQFYSNAGFMGRMTLFEWLGVDAGVVVVGVFVMAMGAFWFAEQCERLFSKESATSAMPPRTKLLRRSAVATGLAVALVTLMVGQPTVDSRVAAQETELNARIESREVFIDSAELLDVMHNNQVQIVLLDVRSEANFNVFHLAEAQRITLAELDQSWVGQIPSEAVVVVMSNDEAEASQAWKRLAVRENVNAYVLAGGVNRWLDIYQRQLKGVPGSDSPAGTSDAFRSPFDKALGARVAAARPKLKDVAPRTFNSKVKMRGPVRAASGGCG